MTQMNNPPTHDDSNEQSLSHMMTQTIPVRYDDSNEQSPLDMTQMNNLL